MHTNQQKYANYTPLTLLNLILTSSIKLAERAYMLMIQYLCSDEPLCPGAEGGQLHPVNLQPVATGNYTTCMSVNSCQNYRSFKKRFSLFFFAKSNPIGQFFFYKMAISMFK